MQKISAFFNEREHGMGFTAQWEWECETTEETELEAPLLPQATTGEPEEDEVEEVAA